MNESTEHGLEYGEIVCERVLGVGVRVLTAPDLGLMSPEMLTASEAIRFQGPNVIIIADQVAYRVIGWEPNPGALILKLVHDYRPQPEPEAKQ